MEDSEYDPSEFRQPQQRKDRRSGQHRRSIAN